MNNDVIAGCLLGTAVGDALGLPYEGISPRRAERLLGAPTRFRFLFGRGMVSDDTEHACLTWQSLVEANGNDDLFAKQLASHLRRWFLGLPAGIGLATARACLKLLFGWGPRRSGVFSAGNGPAMRAPILGAAIDDLDQLQQLIRTSTRMTHTDPKAEQAALAIGLAAWTARREATPDAQEYFRRVRDQLATLPAEDLLLKLGEVQTSLANGQSTTEFAAHLCGNRGVSGYVLQTVPVVLHAWLSHPRDYRAAVMSVIRCGGDADTTAAILGGIIGAGVGSAGIPSEWLGKLIEWPQSVASMRQLAEHRLTDNSTKPIRTTNHPWPFVLARNLFFLAVVLCHGFRRLFPPY